MTRVSESVLSTGLITTSHGVTGKHPHFSVTGDMQEWNSGQWRAAGGGAIHKQIFQHFPELGPYIQWHLVSTEQPLHYLANAQYWWEKVIGTSKWPPGPGEPDPMEAFLSTIVLGGLPGDAAPDTGQSWEQVKEWLEYRLPFLQRQFREDMRELGVL